MPAAVCTVVSPYSNAANQKNEGSQKQNACLSLSLSDMYEKLAVQGLNNFKSKIIICHAKNWLFNIIFRDYLDGETEYIKKI